MKKLINLLIVLMLVFVLTACGGMKENGEEKTIEESVEKLKAFDKSAEISETVLFDENGVKITATGLT